MPRPKPAVPPPPAIALRVDNATYKWLQLHGKPKNESVGQTIKRLLEIMKKREGA